MPWHFQKSLLKHHDSSCQALEIQISDASCPRALLSPIWDLLSRNDQLNALYLCLFWDFEQLLSFALEYTSGMTISYNPSITLCDKSCVWPLFPFKNICSILFMEWATKTLYQSSFLFCSVCLFIHLQVPSESDSTGNLFYSYALKTMSAGDNPMFHLTVLNLD